MNDSGDNALTVGGFTKSNQLGWTETMSSVRWAHLAGSTTNSNIGYYFPGTATVSGLREARSGSWKDINTGATNPVPITRNYLSLALNHGVNPANASYSYVLLPNYDAAATASYAANSNISILENSSDVQAVKDSSINVVGANFWNDATKTVSVDGASFITSNKKASVTTMETSSQLEVGISDPTQANMGTIDLEIKRKATGVISLDPGITVTQLSPTIKMTVNVNGSLGKTFNAKFNLGAAAPAATPTLNSAIAGNGQVTLNWSAAMKRAIRSSTARRLETIPIRWNNVLLCGICLQHCRG